MRLATLDTTIARDGPVTSNTAQARFGSGKSVERVEDAALLTGKGLFADDAPLSAALGQFVHVYVDRQSRQPVPLPAPLLAALAPLHLSTSNAA